MKEYIAVSSCLLGLNTKYTGSNNYNELIEELIKDKTVIPICPEVFGGLSIPREPSEENDEAILYMIGGRNVTKEYHDGAERTLDLLKRYNCKKVVLKNGSPSCGKYTYDGTFTGKKKMDRMGVTARLLKENDIELIYID